MDCMTVRAHKVLYSSAKQQNNILGTFCNKGTIV